MFNGKFVIPGALSVSAFKHTLEKALKDQQENTVGEDAYQCGPEGFRI